MKKKEILLIYAILLFLPFHAKSQLKVTYLTDDFLNYYSLSKDSSDEQKIKCFKMEVYDKAPLIYESLYNDIKWIGQVPENWLLRYVDEFRNIEQKFIELSGVLQAQFDSSLSEFQKTFPDFRPDFDVCILHSLGIRAGGPVTIQNKTVLMFGVDQMAKHFNFVNFNPFFQHELAHIYHAQYYTPIQHEKYAKDAIYNFLWREGLAVYISSVLNPDAREIEVFMIDSLPQKTNQVIQNIACDLAGNLFSTDKKMIEKYFWTSSKDSIIPKTAGYYMGYLMVKEIAKKYPLTELVKLQEEQFIPEFEHILKTLSN